MHALWKGSISLGLINIPVKMYAASKDRVIEFHNLHSKCHTPIENKRWCPKCNKEVPWEEVEKGYEIEKGKFVVITKEELEAIKLKSTKAIEIIEFVDSSQIDPILIEKNYYLVPQEGGEKAYSLFKDVLEISGKAAIGKVVMRNKEYLVALRPYKKTLLLTVLHYKDEITPVEELEELKHLVVVRENELKLAQMLIDKLSGEFRIEKFKDNYSKTLIELIKKKAHGEKIEKAEVKVEPTKESDLMLLLKKSVEEIKKRKRKS